MIGQRRRQNIFFTSNQIKKYTKRSRQQANKQKITNIFLVSLCGNYALCASHHSVEVVCSLLLSCLTAYAKDTIQILSKKGKVATKLCAKAAYKSVQWRGRCSRWYVIAEIKGQNN